MASFRKRYNNWEYRLFYVDRRTGEWKESFASGFQTKKAAEIAAVDMDQQILKWFDPGEANQTLETYLNWWFETYKEGAVSLNTEKNIRNCLNMVIRNIGYMKLSELDRPAYQRLINKISPDYAKSILQRMNTTIREAFLDAMVAGLDSQQPSIQD